MFLVDSVAVRSSSSIGPGQLVQILEQDPKISSSVETSSLPNFSIIFEDEYIIVVDKPAGLTVHPGAGRPYGTLMDMIVSDRPEMIGVGQEGRWGIVHRLDRDTSGVMVVAKNPQSVRFPVKTVQGTLHQEDIPRNCPGKSRRRLRRYRRSHRKEPARQETYFSFNQQG